MNIRSLFVSVSLLLLSGQSFSVAAISIFQWVDAEGVTHFSERTPADLMSAKQLSQYEIGENFPQSRQPEEDYFSIVNQWKRANDERESRLKLQYYTNRSVRQLTPVQTQAVSLDYERPNQRRFSGILPYPYSYNRGQGQHWKQFRHSKQSMEAAPTQPLPGYAGNVGPDGFRSK